MPLQYPNPYNPYQEPRVTNWPKIILITLGILVLIVAVYFTFNYFEKRGDNINNNDGLDVNNGSQGIAVGEPNPNGYDCSRDVYNCGNFTTQGEAQVAFDSCFSQYGDVWQLDSDKDGNVCEGMN